MISGIFLLTMYLSAVRFSALTLLAGWHEGHSVVKKARCSYPQKFSFEDPAQPAVTQTRRLVKQKWKVEVHLFIRCISLMAACLWLSVSENLSSSADAFRVKARRLQRQMWWKECRVIMIVYLHCKLDGHFEPFTVHQTHALGNLICHWDLSVKLRF